MGNRAGGQLVVLTGPVGGGKSTVALADHLRQTRRPTAVIELDSVYCMVRQRAGFDEADAWRCARRGAAALADTCFADGLKVVIVEGGFFDEEERQDLCAHLASSVSKNFITLDVSWQETLRRVQADTGRGISRDPQFLHRLHSRFVGALPFLRTSSVVLAADRLMPQELAELIAETVLAHEPSG